MGKGAAEVSGTAEAMSLMVPLKGLPAAASSPPHPAAWATPPPATGP